MRNLFKAAGTLSAVISLTMLLIVELIHAVRYIQFVLSQK